MNDPQVERKTVPKRRSLSYVEREATEVARTIVAQAAHDLVVDPIAVDPSPVCVCCGHPLASGQCIGNRRKGTEIPIMPAIAAYHNEALHIRQRLLDDCDDVSVASTSSFEFVSDNECASSDEEEEA